MPSESPQRRSPSPQSAADGPVPTKQLACAGCRSIKVRCITPVDSEACKRCIRLEQTCERMAPGRPGRPCNHNSLQRAFHLIEREFDKAHRTSSPSASNAGLAAPRRPSESLSVLRRSRSPQRRQPSIAGSPALPAMPSPRPMPMLPSPGAARFRPLLGNVPGSRTAQQPHADVQASPSSSPLFPILPEPFGVTSQALTNGISPATEQSCSSWYEGVDSVDDNEGELTNPVRLLVEAAEASARVSELSRPASASGPPTIPLQYTLPDTLRSLANEGEVDERLAHLAADAEYLAEGLQLMTSDAAPAGLTSAEKSFFKPFRKSIRRELEIEYDPLARSLINEREACVFFDAYFQRLHPLLPVLDPTLHTMEFIHRRSLFLFSVICAHGASMTSGAEEATKRLRWHAQRLAEMINPKGYASVEIIQAFLIWSTWLPSSERFQEERLWHEAKYAINMAVEIGLMIPVPDNPDQLATVQNLASCFENIDVAGTLLVRRASRNC
ncbi:uncharacterized protein CcaverHIS019_0400060 [Cutaneotrichosporon cavernicola]|uniref:Zn(2)-C6 fungal-type domain-containing protein n=1 Tax=Cutaneotrichosporon cavernicola TaxID=279322 RepID=A0AA48QVC5_9TREE|nr:uncharacterized protein CcaverHIS019_0400060 [Cutaneotrichosporon cavernicola]BEI91186.1 hypothetical protein CcaverHIS019_0400060 [Cutaneotrichosporon cavernicola]